MSSWMERFEIQARKKVRNYPFLMGEHVWMDSEKLGWDDEVREVLKLARCPSALSGWRKRWWRSSASTTVRANAPSSWA